MLILRNPALIAFEAIALAGTVHGAAKAIGLTQTAVTLRLKALEYELSMTLFLRSRKGMALTEEGKALLQLCRGQKELEGQFLSQVTGDERTDISLTIVGPTSTISSRIVNACNHLYAKFPFLNLHYKTEDNLNVVDMVRTGVADLAIVHPSLVPDEMDSKMLKPDKYLLVCSSNWKGRRLADIISNERIIDFYQSDRTTLNYLKIFNLGEKNIGKRLFANNNAALIRLFCAEIGFGTLVESIARPHLESGELIALNQSKCMEDKLALIWYPRPAKQSYFEEILKSIK